MGMIGNVLWAGGITFLLVSVFLLWLGLKAQKKPQQTGDIAMIGEGGIVRKKVGYRNRLVVEVRGELWWAITDTPQKLKKDSEIKVIEVDRDDLILVVEPFERS